MEENCLPYGIEILESDWEKTTANVKKLVEQMGQHIKQSEKELALVKSPTTGTIRKNQSHIFELQRSAIFRPSQC